jgi:hypothetical protein
MSIAYIDSAGSMLKIWFRRNTYVFEDVFTHPDEVYATAVESLREYKFCKQSDQIVQQPQSKNWF